MHPSFHISEEASPELITFLSNTILGTNGAQYQHMDTEKRIQEMENPLHLSLIRNGKILGNISFARRDKNWYVRYFAFDKAFQGKGEISNERDKNSYLKRELREFFSSKIESGEVECFYAYIDPNNDRSHAAGAALGFSKNGQVYTQTYSRILPKVSPRFSEVLDSNVRDQFIVQTFEDEHLYYKQKKYDKTYCLKNTKDEIIAFANVSKLQWIIHRLPGRYGKALVSILPYIPVLSSLIRPKHHKFTGVDHVWIEKDDPKLLEELFSSILHQENQKMIIWWAGEKELKFSNDVRWGIMHALLKRSPVDIYKIDKDLNNSDIKVFLSVKDFS